MLAIVGRSELKISAAGLLLESRDSHRETSSAKTETEVNPTTARIVALATRNTTPQSGTLNSSAVSENLMPSARRMLAIVRSLALASLRSTLMNGITAVSPGGTRQPPQSAIKTAIRQSVDDLPPRRPTRTTQRRRPERKNRSIWFRHHGEVGGKPAATRARSSASYRARSETARLTTGRRSMNCQRCQLIDWKDFQLRAEARLPVGADRWNQRACTVP